MHQDESKVDSSAESAYFYLSKIQRPSSIQVCVHANFTSTLIQK